MSDQQRLQAIVDDEPGIHFNQLVRTLDVSPDKTQRIIDDLVSDGAVVRDDHYGKTHVYPTEFDPWERECLALLRRETARDILTTLLTREVARPDAIAEAVGIARSTLEWHCERLERARIIEKHWDSGRVTYELRDRDQLESLLEKVEPRLRDTWLDRAERLFDHVLESSSR